MFKITSQNITYILTKYEYKYKVVKNWPDESIICFLKQTVYPNTNMPVQINFNCSEDILKDIFDYKLNDYLSTLLKSSSRLSPKQANMYLVSSAYDNNLVYQNTNSKIGKLIYKHEIDEPTELINVLGLYQDFYHDLSKQLNKLKFQ